MKLNPYLEAKESIVPVLEPIGITGDDRNYKAECRAYKEQMRDWEIEADVRRDKIAELEKQEE
jgi:hypothetical protein